MLRAERCCSCVDVPLVLTCFFRINLSLHSLANHSACARYHSSLPRASGCTAVFAVLPRALPKEGCLFGGEGSGGEAVQGSGAHTRHG